MIDIESKKEIRFIDLFAGVGGFRLGLERCNNNQYESEDSKQTNSQMGRFRNIDEQEQSLQSSDNTSFRCIYSNEWDKYAVSVYRKHWKECDETDITLVKSEDIPNHNLLCAGFPCQTFSIAGKRSGFEDTRGTLFFEIAKILRDKGPKMVLLENVKGLLSHDSGRTFATILNILRELGYVGQYEVLNSKNFGVPQNRERIFIFGFRGESAPQVFPLGECSEKSIETLRKTQGNGAWVQALDSNYWKGGGTRTMIQRKEIIYYQKADRKIARIYEINGISPSLLKTGSWQEPRINSGSKIRRLTPKECERLQGFPDDFTKFDENGKQVSDNQRYKMMGNAVTVNVIQAIGEKILKSLNST